MNPQPRSQFGNFSTKQQKGGFISWQKRRSNPDYYRKLGCIVPNKFRFPRLNDPALSEFIGIVLGDGGITNAQVHITLNSIADKDYIDYVTQLINKLFHHHAGIYHCKHAQAIRIIITGVDFIKYLQSLGLSSGNKVKNQSAVPGWICQDITFSTACLRGLIDTDGGIFRHTYKVKDVPYQYVKLCFSNCSQPLRSFVFQTLTDLKFHPKMRHPKRVWLYSQTETFRYIQVVGTSNSRLVKNIRATITTPESQETSHSWPIAGDC